MKSPHIFLAEFEAADVGKIELSEDKLQRIQLPQPILLEPVMFTSSHRFDNEALNV